MSLVWMRRRLLIRGIEIDVNFYSNLKVVEYVVQTYVLRLLSNELIGQSVYVCSLGSTHLEFFLIGNGVKQGCIVSPLLVKRLHGQSLVNNFTGC